MDDGKDKSQSESGIIIKKDSMVGIFAEDVEKHYRFIKELGAGAFGKVYLVEHRLSKKNYACKRLSKKKIKNKESILAEIKLLKTLDHPNIVKLFEVYEDRVYLFLVMEELKGGELFDRILSRAQNKNYYSEKQVALLFKQILSSINYCHEIGICHRDIKPENIVFSDASEDSTVKLIDFGLSKSFRQGNKGKDMKTRAGTCYYMSPEVIKGVYNEKCDVWSLGVLLYVLVSGRAPFNGADDNAILKKVSDMNYQFKWEGWKLISEDCKDVIRKMLVDVKSRPSAAEIMKESWVSLGAPSAKDTPIDIDLDEIRTYGKLDKLSKAVNGLIAFRLSEDDVKELNLIFQSFDKNGDGSLSINELLNGLEMMKKTKNLDISEKELKKIFDGIDLDKNGVINYNEFIAASFDKKKVQTRDNMYHAFKLLDKDNNGKISLNELEKIITIDSEADLEEMQDIFGNVDKNGDGEIDFDEFMKNFCSETEV